MTISFRLSQSVTTHQRVRSVSAIEIFSMAVEALWSNKLRTGLTMLGVIIGIASVIAITSVGQGVQKATEQQIQALGTDVLQVFAGAARTGGISKGVGSSSTLTWEDAKAIQEQVPVAQVVSAYLQRPGQVVYGRLNHSTNIVGIDLNYLQARSTLVKQGRFFTQAELDNAQSVAILGPTVRDELFGSGKNSVGEQIRIQNNIYEVIGVLEPKGSEGPMDRDDQVFIPLTNMSGRIVGNNAINGFAVNGIYVKLRDQGQSKTAQFQVVNLLRLRHNLSPDQSDDFSIRNQTDVVKTFTTVVGLFTVMVVAIASISLLVGGIGIANIMLVSVVERTREIGIRKAVGATNSAILNQFLAESIVISTTGGGIGMGVGIAIAFGSAMMFNFPFVISIWSVVCGLGLSFIVGLLAGVIPARNAAQLDPIVALRSD
ncbi:ABC transporter permease [Iningainema tapete]|uniref:ABC transporter permease n=1 Tax=Iningainema tapete BLCC-T55 TaxID=2748662 RepID=A0A8J6XS52_9CYAN|nr:ABC transporter permease [Iningainema tapete]MBD2776511.1 ABC transporter permease [Iningainema tapete BLCC-T55]